MIPPLRIAVLACLAAFLPATAPELSAGFAERDGVRAVVIASGGVSVAFADGGEGPAWVGKPEEVGGGSASAVRAAEQALEPARVRFGRTSLRGLVRSRTGPASALDEALYALELVGEDGDRIAVVALAAARPDPAPPGVLCLAGSPGDQAVSGEGFPARLDRALAEAEPLTGGLSTREIPATLPRSLLEGETPTRAAIRRIEIGSLAILAVPGEIDAGPAVDIRSALEDREGGRRFVVAIRTDHLGRFPSETAWHSGVGGMDARYGPRGAQAIARALGVGPPDSGPVPRRGIAEARERGRTRGRDRAGEIRRAIARTGATPTERFRRAASLRNRHRFLPPREIAEMEGLAEGAEVSYEGVFLTRALAGDGIEPRDYPPNAEVEELAPASELTRFSVDRVWMDSEAPSGIPVNDRFPVEHYVPRDGAKAGIIVLPIWRGGVLLAERVVAGYLARRGYECAIVPLPYQFQRTPPGERSGDLTVSSDLERTRDAMLQALADVRSVADWLHGRSEIEGGRLGVLGISLGAHVAAAAYQADPRFDSGIIVMAGGDPASMVWDASRETARMKRELVARGVTLEEAREFLRPLDPATVRPFHEFPGFPRYRGALMFNGTEDTVIPPKNAKILHRALGECAIRWLPVTHYTMAFRIGDVLEMAREHLDQIHE